MGNVDLLLTEIVKRRHHPAIVMSGMGDVLKVLAEYLAETDARIKRLEILVMNGHDR